LSAPTYRSTAELRGQILRDTSRSFYLSIRLLPGGAGDPVALAYLLARATDTIADTADIDVATRQRELAALAGLIHGGGAAHDFTAFAARQTNPAECALILRIPDCLAWLAAMSGDDQRDIRAVLSHIIEGQSLDLQRFANVTQPTALQTDAELDRYTYLVAGSVGKFWTRVCERRLPQFSTLSHEQMLSLGVAYGKGLQLVNILRDAGEDLRAGRCYLPAEDPTRLADVMPLWLDRAEQGMNAGIEYSCAVRNWRVRLATVLPALIGMRTLAQIRTAGAAVLTHRVKVPRAEVRQLLWKTAASLASPRVIRKLAGSSAAASR
jgi:farnesyl-diphosphate farnesyltransferase